MANEVSHDEFYRAVAATAGIDWSQHPIMPKVREQLAKGDVHLNGINLGWWDLQAASPVLSANLRRALKEHGDYYSMAGAVCVLKAAAKVAAEGGGS